MLEANNSGVTERKGVWDKIEKYNGIIHMVLIATKPDIIKQFPLVDELKRRGEFVLVVHSGQHYDWNLSGGMEQEFSIEPDFNLNVRGQLYEQQAQIIQRLGSILERMQGMKKKVIPYTYGDTTTAVAGGIAGYLNKYAIGHVEAGLRTMTPAAQTFFDLLKKGFDISSFDVEGYYEKLKNSEGWKKGSYEPFPEQFDTRAAAPSAGIHFAPTPLNKQHLLDEGYSERRIFIVGNPVADALKFAEKHVENSKIFEKYPQLESDNVVRFCIHRRENVSCLHRFKSLYKAMVSLIESGKTVLLISLGATEKALNEFGFKQQIQKLAEKHKNFIYSPVWPLYTDVVAAMKKCRAVATDSGSIQEETNVLGLPCIVLRFNSDRPEAVFAGSNTIAPPIKPEVVAKIISEVMDNDALNKKMRSTRNLYGVDVSQKTVDIVKKVMERESLFELFEHEQLGLDKEAFWEKGQTDW
jgi:UDP-N-acetylglucosamine 2-epimerase (non-hydrolysing)